MAVAALLTGLIADAQPAQGISTDQFATQATQFLRKEVAAHVADIKSLDPPQALVVGARTGGDFSWGTFMRAAMAWSALSGENTVAGRPVASFLGKAGLIEARGGGKTFSQWYAALTLRHFGTDLKTNPLWQSLPPEEQAAWRSLLDPGRFYDRKTRKVIDLPENYFGIAARVAAIDYETGITTDRAFVDDILGRAAEQIVKGALYTDDALPDGRYDRYSQEYARSLYEVAESVGRKDIMTAVDPALKAVMRTWWDLVSPDGYSYPWGRTIGAISYMDTMDIIGFLAQYPQFRPAPLPQLASVYRAAWEWLKQDYLPDRHLLNVFGFGRGNFSYINRDREWQQTTQFLGKAANSLMLLRAAMAKEGVTSFPAAPQLPQVARFEWFRKGDRPAGVWLVRGARLRFALPFSTGTVSGIADYLPAPHGLPGFAAPVEQTVPALTPYLELSDGRTIVAGDCADEIEPSATGRGVRAVWKRWAVVGGKAAQFTDPGLESQVTWRIDGDALIRSEKVTASRPVEIRNLSVMFPSTGDVVSTTYASGHRTDRFESTDGTVEVTIENSAIPFTASLRATGNAAQGRGTRGPIPFILQFRATGLVMKAQESLTWTIRLRELPGQTRL
jgi:hypothetical protein